MSEGTKIEWCDYTFNPWEGCTKVSDGCKNCYAEARNKRFSAGANWGKGKPRRRTSSATWRKPLKWNEWPFICGRCGRGWSCAGRCLETMEHDPCGGELRRQRAFPSLCDWLDDEVPIEWLADFLKLIHDTPNLDWLLLTKRPENFLRIRHIGNAGSITSPGMKFPKISQWARQWFEGTPPPNIWIGVSVENQEMADKRIPELLKIPARVRFLSCEPLLGPIDLSAWMLPKSAGIACWCRGTARVHDWKPGEACPTAPGLGLDWAIVGGESGPGARPCYVQWIHSIKGQCRLANVPVFVKQVGAFPVIKSESEWETPTRHLSFNTACTKDIMVNLKHKKGGDPSEWPESLRVREFPVLARSHVV